MPVRVYERFVLGSRCRRLVTRRGDSSYGISSLLVPGELFVLEKRFPHSEKGSTIPRTSFVEAMDSHLRKTCDAARHCLIKNPPGEAITTILRLPCQLSGWVWVLPGVRHAVVHSSTVVVASKPLLVEGRRRKTIRYRRSWGG